MEIGKTVMKKKIYTTAIILIVCALIFASAGCFIRDSARDKYYIDIGQVEDSRVASIVANNTVASCVRISAEYKSIGRVSKSAGFFVTPDGYVITNRHCVVRFTNGEDLPSQSNSNELPIHADYVVSDINGESYNARLVAYSKSADIALLKIVPKILDTVVGITNDFQPVVFDTESEPYYGERLYTFGNPEDIGFIFYQLIVASPSVKLSGNDSHASIVLDGNINHGNSGGPLINNRSSVVGLIFGRIEGKATNLPVDSDSKTYGLGCAIPAKLVTDFLDAQNIDYDTYTPPTDGGEADGE